MPVPIPPSVVRRLERFLQLDVAGAGRGQRRFAEFQSGIVVPYSSDMLVNRPGYTGQWQNVHYLPEVADAWLRGRFGQLCGPLVGHAVAGDSAHQSGPAVRLGAAGSGPGLRLGMQRFFGFATTDASRRVSATKSGLVHVGRSPSRAGEPLHWRVRACSTSWRSMPPAAPRTPISTAAPGRPAAAPVELVDEDADGLPDAWERHWFGDLEKPPRAMRTHGLNHAQEYASGANPLKRGHGRRRLGADRDEVATYGTHPAQADTDGGRPERSRRSGDLRYRSAAGGHGRRRARRLRGSRGPRAPIRGRPTRMGTGFSDHGKSPMGLNPLSNDAAEDPDDDGLTNTEEIQSRNGSPERRHRGDGLSDSAELATYGTDTLGGGFDGDDLDDGAEVLSHATDPGIPTRTAMACAMAGKSGTASIRGPPMPRTIPMPTV